MKINEEKYGEDIYKKNYICVNEINGNKS